MFLPQTREALKKGVTDFGNLNIGNFPTCSTDECEDQFDTCPEMSKNHYCTNYPELMKIQCKKSCGFCGKICGLIIALKFNVLIPESSFHQNFDSSLFIFQEH